MKEIEAMDQEGFASVEDFENSIEPINLTEPEDTEKIEEDEFEDDEIEEPEDLDKELEDIEKGAM